MHWGREMKKRQQDGFTVIEMALATVTLLVGIMSISAATLRMFQLGRQNHEKVRAHNAVHAVAERINSASAIASQNPDTLAQTIIDTYGVGGSVGAAFQVPGLTPQIGETRVGKIEIITNETKTDAELGAAMSMPRDLNGDGDALDTNVTGDARVLGIIITVKWRDKGVKSQYKHPLFIMGH